MQERENLGAFDNSTGERENPDQLRLLSCYKIMLKLQLSFYLEDG